MSLWRLILTAALLAGTAAAQTAELIISGAAVETMDPRYQGGDIRAVAIAAGRIIALGSDADMARHRGEKTVVIDAGGGFLMPGFIEGHGHFAGLGASLRVVDLTGAASADELVQRMGAAAATLPPGAWAIGRGWDQNLWKEKAFPHHRDLSAALPDRPAWLVRVDGHAALANAAALAAAGVTRATAAPAGGEIIRDAAGEPTGVLIDHAMRLVARCIPETSVDLLKSDLLAAQARCFAEGITSFHDAGAGRDTVAAMADLMRSDELRIRLYVMLGGSGSARAADFAVPPLIGAHDHRLTVRAIKLGIDGALGSRGAALLEDYADRPGHRGLLMIGPKDLRAIGAAALDAGYQVCVHAIGDQGCRVVLEAWEGLFAERPLGRSARFRVEHAQIVDAADFERFAPLGLIASMQGIHCTSDMPWVPERIGEARTLEGAYAWREFLARGTVLCNGTDAPVEDVSALASFHATVTRQRRDGTPPGGWQPAQRLSRREALYSYTMAGAYAAFEENLKGSITPGKLADLVLLDRDLVRCSDAEIPGTAVRATIVGGRVVYRAP